MSAVRQSATTVRPTATVPTATVPPSAAPAAGRRRAAKPRRVALPPLPEPAAAVAAQLADRARTWLAAHTLDALRITLGLVFLLFGALKAVPGLSPAEPLVVRTLDTLTFGLITGHTALLVTAVLEVAIGLTLTFGVFLRTGLVILAGSLVGIFSPLVLFAGDMFADGPTLEAQYIIKDIVLVAAGLAVAAKALGARVTFPGGPDGATTGR